MHMPYTKNPQMPRVRMQAVRLVKQGWSMRKVGRYMGFNHTAISKWVKRADEYNYKRIIPTLSSRPHNHPRALKQDMIDAIVKQREKSGRCAKVVCQELKNKGIVTNISSVQRTLDRKGLIKKKSPWKRLYKNIPRPLPIKPGRLVQTDTIHIILPNGKRFYVYTLVDVFSRWAYARVSTKINTHRSTKFIKEAQRRASFVFQTIQSDNGPEFSKWFSQNIGISHRHSRIRQPNDNSHVERFNRTIKEECLNKTPLFPVAFQRAINNYMPYYNNHRLHLGINLKTPVEWCQAID